MQPAHEGVPTNVSNTVSNDGVLIKDNEWWWWLLNAVDGDCRRKY